MGSGPLISLTGSAEQRSRDRVPWRGPLTTLPLEETRSAASAWLKNSFGGLENGGAVTAAQ
jgi:hypothetical protein